ncbi:MAG: nucleotidyltransferase [Elusimicrobia bacterium CG_4_10_14_0_8_um_filter_37_32]|nr:MAG: nucleotidyltransferase [Elusimicrobia bacterium CG02_land_8_20_14_3_00_37_13]PIZ13934.1 MAG: nucleotidyltransferase [Elusimicrobia bacterium CG_4_10_14_0_8_um_filter_37_32]
MKKLEKNLDKIGKIFLEKSVIFAYLFGSCVEGKVGKISDIDIAVYFDDKLTSSVMFDKKLKIMAELSSLLDKDEIDIVILNDAYPLIEHRIIKNGKVIFSIDESRRIDYEVKAVMRYLDFKPYIEKYTKETLYGR